MSVHSYRCPDCGASVPVTEGELADPKFPVVDEQQVEYWDGEGYLPEFFLFHQSGPTLRATFSSANDAYIWQKGNRGTRRAEMFYFTDADGKRVTFEDQPRYPGHAYAIMAKLDKK